MEDQFWQSGAFLDCRPRRRSSHAFLTQKAGTSMEYQLWQDDCKDFTLYSVLNLSLRSPEVSPALLNVGVGKARNFETRITEKEFWRKMLVFYALDSLSTVLCCSKNQG